MNENLRRLRDAVVRQTRDVEVRADGRVQEIEKSSDGREPPRPRSKPTKLARRTFGAVALDAAIQLEDGRSHGSQTLQAALSSAEHLRVFLPVHDQLGRAFPARDSLHGIRDTLLPIAGGATVIDAVGSWSGTTRRVTHERIRVLESYLPQTLTGADIARLLEVLWRLLRVTRQESVAVAVDGSLFQLSANGKIVAPRSFSRSITT